MVRDNLQSDFVWAAAIRLPVCLAQMSRRFQFNCDMSRLKIANIVVEDRGRGQRIVKGDDRALLEPNFGGIEYRAEQLCWELLANVFSRRRDLPGNVQADSAAFVLPKRAYA